MMMAAVSTLYGWFPVLVYCKIVAACMCHMHRGPFGSAAECEFARLMLQIALVATLHASQNRIQIVNITYSVNTWVGTNFCNYSGFFLQDKLQEFGNVRQNWSAVKYAIRTRHSGDKLHTMIQANKFSWVLQNKMIQIIIAMFICYSPTSCTNRCVQQHE